ncbi:hypothetical protein MSSIT_1210 [Methanosarcina siciliae T4/M]|uniref:Uncharacterized protein n=2 Tax=Methanosarcina siciliae TaxID=38027 RepID=A0A0E3PC11_9EURY|nr:hypothetical protein [Methanosarcina siciliae]AKB27929.1 hypothetical protein MSSIT_1210 [Methanosarcina siciliae T4/M]AKB31852.1 hypothetical protein MSSIH_1162 [Methanosarcina siciliae HI350]
MKNSNIIENVLEKAGNKNLINELTNRLSQSEITTFLLALSKEMANRNTPNGLLSRYEANRFVKPSGLNPIQVKQAELLMLEMAEASGFSPVLLSPAGLLGSCSVIAKVDQNNVISATRGLELIADSTNMLAIYLADGIKKKTIDNTKSPVHLSATCRVTRGQMFQSMEFVPHFSLFTLASSGKDRGSYGFEKNAIARHMEFYISYFGEKLGHKFRVSLNIRNGYADKTGFIERIHLHLRERYPNIDFTVNLEETDNSYYQGINFKLSVNDVEIVDGGFVDWTQKLLGNKKERLLISGAGVDLQLITGMPDKKI